MHTFSPFSLKWTAVPANSGIAIAFDSTRGLVYRTQAGVVSGSEYLIPGPWTGRYPAALVRGFVHCTGQDVTIKTYIRSEFDGDANDWELDAEFDTDGQLAVTAGTTQPVEWKPSGTDFMFRVDAGATAPTVLNIVLDILPTSDFGS